MNLAQLTGLFLSLSLSPPLATGSNSLISRSQLSAAVRDAVDSSMASIGASTSGSSVYQSFKERTVSVSSVNEEEDEPASLLSDRCRYISVSEEDELLAATTTATTTITASTITLTDAAIASTSAAAAAAAAQAAAAAAASAAAATQAQSVITEQPTASRKLKLDLLLASADIITQPLTQQHIQEEEEEEVEKAGDKEGAETSGKQRKQQQVEAEQVKETKSDIAVGGGVASDPQTDQPVNIYVTPSTSTTATATADGTAGAGAGAGAVKSVSEDSDEYRSLEGRDEADYPISE